MSNWMKVWLCLLALVILYHLLPPIAHGETAYAEIGVTETTVNGTTFTGTFTVTTPPWVDEWHCKQCLPDKPCGITVPAADGCNTCYKPVWCEDGKWKTYGIQSCTLALCNQVFEIENPFKGRK